jgi:SAM-dependent methyltransferase
MAKFEPRSYSQYRTHYPEEIFAPLKSFLGPCSSEPLRVLDLGAGTGISSHSFLSFYPYAEVTLVEPDPQMLQESLKTLSGLPHSIERIVAPAESFEISKPVDLILVGSAWHWMDPEKAIHTMLRYLRPGGVIYIFEYQFPKAKMPDHLSLNEWVRREFNLKWRVPDQKPRGTLRELTKPLRAQGGVVERGSISFQKMERFDLESFWGALISQSRYLAYEQTLPFAEIPKFRDKMRQELALFWNRGPEIECSYWLEGYCFQRTHV